MRKHKPICIIIKPFLGAVLRQCHDHIFFSSLFSVNAFDDSCAIIIFYPFFCLCSSIFVHTQLMAAQYLATVLKNWNCCFRSQKPPNYFFIASPKSLSSAYLSVLFFSLAEAKLASWVDKPRIVNFFPFAVCCSFVSFFALFTATKIENWAKTRNVHLQLFNFSEHFFPVQLCIHM